MCYPDLAIVLSGSEISVILPLRNRYLHKPSVNWNDIASLIAWIRDLGIKELFIRICVTDSTLIGMALDIAVKLRTSDNIVGLSVSTTAERNPRRVLPRLQETLNNSVFWGGNAPLLGTALFSPWASRLVCDAAGNSIPLRRKALFGMANDPCRIRALLTWSGVYCRGPNWSFVSHIGKGAIR